MCLYTRSGADMQFHTKGLNVDLLVSGEIPDLEEKLNVVLLS